MVSRKKQGNRPQKNGSSSPSEGFRNRVRGAVAAFKKLPVGQRSELRWASEQRAIGVLNRAMSDARQRLSPNNRDLWIWVQISLSPPYAK